MCKLMERIFAKARRLLVVLGLIKSFRQVEFFESKDFISKKLLVIGPGSVPIPPKGWGAVETIIHETIPVYLNSGFKVFLVNSKNILDYFKGKRFQPDVILLHEDTAIRRLRFLFPNIPIVLVTHYGLAAFPNLWGSSYRRAFRNFRYASKIVCLSPEILRVFKEYLPEGKLLLCPNGTNFESSEDGSYENGLIYLGKVEPRKKQFELYKYFKDADVNVTFVGEIQDDRVIGLMAQDPGAKKAFVGPWTRDLVAQNLPTFTGLLLLSEGEADALVLYEAQIAGLPIIVTPSAVGSQDLSLPWIYVHSLANPISEVTNFLKAINISNQSIANYARSNYRWEHRIENLVKVLLSNARNYEENNL